VNSDTRTLVPVVRNNVESNSHKYLLRENRSFLELKSVLSLKNIRNLESADWSLLLQLSLCFVTGIMYLFYHN